jgi:hypothetical protein
VVDCPVADGVVVAGVAAPGVVAPGAGVLGVAVVCCVAVVGFGGKRTACRAIPATMITTETTTARSVFLSIIPSSQGTGSYPPA